MYTEYLERQKLSNLPCTNNLKTWQKHYSVICAKHLNISSC